MITRTCPHCGNHLTIVAGDGCAASLITDMQRSAACPWCGQALWGRPSPAPSDETPSVFQEVSQVTVYRWFARLSDAEQGQVFADLARLRAWVGHGGVP